MRAESTLDLDFLTRIREIDATTLSLTGEDQQVFRSLFIVCTRKTLYGNFGGYAVCAVSASVAIHIRAEASILLTWRSPDDASDSTRRQELHFQAA